MLNAVSLFSGAGGFCEGVRFAGWNVLCGVEADSQACETYAANFPDVALFKGDIGRFLLDEQPDVPTLDELLKAGVDVVYGGPPCQGFSQIGPRKSDDPRNLLYKEFVRVVQALQPRALVMENVPNMIAMENGRFKDEMQDAFRAAGYSRTTVLPLLASEFGVPQHRRRIFWFGLRDRLPLEGELADVVRELMEPQKTPRPVTVRQAISDLPEEVSKDDGPIPYAKKRAGRYSEYQKLMRLDYDSPLLPSGRKQTEGDDALYNHHTKGVEARRKKIIKAIKPGARGNSLPAELWNGTREHKWRRLDPDKPSYTILAQMHRDLSEWIHPTLDRWITVREAARLQSFHDAFVFHGSEWQQLKQVGNAVPPLMALPVARTVAQFLARKRAKGQQ